MAKAEWKNSYEGKEIPTGDNSQLRVNMVETIDGSIQGVATVRKWAKYATKDDKAAGLTKDTVPFRPTTDGVSFPVSAVPSIINDLQAMYDLAVKQGLIEAVTSAPVAEKTATTISSKRKKVV